LATTPQDQAKNWADSLSGDGEFMWLATGWTGGLRVTVDDGPAFGFSVADGQPSGATPQASDDGVISMSAPGDAWAGLTAQLPPPLLTDVHAATYCGLRTTPADILWWQYAPAIQRAVELLRPPRTSPDGSLVEKAAGSFSTPVGRYVNLDLGGTTHRVYFEEAGQGIPLLLQHTAGSHGTQWRHLFEMPEITDHFRLIAYDLPFHGKSVPPVGPEWWAEPYRLKGDFLRSVPVELARILDLDRPVFMGCSVGGLLALDLAHKAPEVFRAVISLEGALNIPGSIDQLPGLHHPQVSNDAKARMMEGMTAPTSPIEYVKETTQTYAAGWPAAFIGDLYYYLEDFDLRDTASEIDTSQLSVHIFAGEYDHNATPAMSRLAHEAIAGSTLVMMDGMGHFPMSENPTRFAEYLLPVLFEIRST